MTWKELVSFSLRLFEVAPLDYNNGFNRKKADRLVQKFISSNLEKEKMPILEKNMFGQTYT